VARPYGAVHQLSISTRIDPSALRLAMNGQDRNQYQRQQPHQLREKKRTCCELGFPGKEAHRPANNDPRKPHEAH